jgi:two-component system chemotaxis response regulator CheB
LLLSWSGKWTQQGSPLTKTLLLREPDIQSLRKDPEAFKAWLQTHAPAQSGPSGSPVSDSEFRILYRTAEFQWLAEVLRSMGVREGKSVELPLHSANAITVQILHLEGRIRVAKGALEVSERLARTTTSTKPAADSTLPQRKLKVLVVDDSVTIRRILRTIVESDPALECCGIVESPSQALQALEQNTPDVITLDIHMPEMDGVMLLKQILAKKFIPTIMISALAPEDGTYVLDALEAGAVDYIQKPSTSEVKSLAPLICEKIKAAASVKAEKRLRQKRPPQTRPDLAQGPLEIDESCLIAIGSSTGGTEALRAILTQLPKKIPPIVIVQHIPAGFSKSFADRMNQLCQFRVKEAENGEWVEPGKVLIAAGSRQMKLIEVAQRLQVVIDDSPPVNRHRPSVDYLFDSIAVLQGRRVVGAILTGMGADGARGLLKLRQMGARTLAQDEATSIVYGMPKEALRMGGAEESVPLDDIASRLLTLSRLVKRPQSA